MRFLFVAFLALFPIIAQAKCNGIDLRTTLTPQQANQFAKQVARIPYSEGMHWVATKGDQAIHVVGTLHSGDSRLNKMMRSVAPYARKADIIVLEAHLRNLEKDFEQLTNKKDLILLNKPPYLDQIMRPDLWQQVKARTSLPNDNNEALRRLQPVLLATTISNPECNPFGWQSQKKGFDEKIERLARRNKIPVMAFETAEQGLRAYMAIPLRDQVKMLEFQMQSKSGAANVATTLRNTYFEETLSLGILLENHFSYRDVKVSRKEVTRVNRVTSSYLLDRRNRNWMPLLMARKEKTIFVAVGGAHLPGKNGLLNLLKARGYKLRRIPMTQ